MNLMKRFFAIASVVQILLGGVVGALAGASKAEAKVREVAQQTVHEEWLARLEQETKKIAADAAEQAAARAVQAAVVPMIKELATHTGQDEERNKRLDRMETRIERLESKR